MYIQTKKRKGMEDIHIVKEAETMHTISQQNAIKLHRLYKLNNINEGIVPKIGDTLHLR